MPVVCPPTDIRATYSYTLHDSIQDVSHDDWDHLRRPGGDPFMDPRLILAVEKSLGGSGRFWHVVFRDEANRPVATACLSTYRVDAGLLADGAAKVVVRAIGKLAPPLVHLNILFCGLCFSAGQSHLRFAPDADTKAILQELDRIAMRLAKQERARAIVFKEFDLDERRQVDELLECGYLLADSLPMNHAPTGPADFQSFYEGLKSSKRHPIRTSQKKFEKAGLRVVQMKGGDGADRIYTDDVHRLYEAVLERAKVRLERLPAEFFRELARRVPDQTAFTFIYEGDRVVAFAASVFGSGVFHQMFVGVDYALNPACDLYFNLFFHALDVGFKQQVQDIYVGQSADTFKQRKLGCHPVPLCFYVKGADRSASFVIRKFFKYLFPPHGPGADYE